MIEFLPVIFFLVAAIYSSAGFAGGSSYLALMYLFNFPVAQASVLALTLNILVSLIGTNMFVMNKELDFGELKWLLAGSLPAAYIGGSISLPSEPLKLVLGIIIFFCAIWIFVTSFERSKTSWQANKSSGKLVSLGIIIGFLSGLVGIGGGIFLAPVFIMLSWGSGKKLSALTSAFILCNSLAALGGKATHFKDIYVLLDYRYLLLAVVAGGLVGPYLALHKFSALLLKRITSFLLLLASLRLILSF